MEELNKINYQKDQGKFKSQRTVNDIVMVKCEISWPQNQVLSGSTRSRHAYDSLSVTGFACIMLDERNVEVKK